MRNLFILLSFWLFAQIGFAQTINFNHAGIKNDSILLIFQDSRGFIWVSTDKGLGIFDGTKFMPTQFLDDEGHLFSGTVSGMKQLDDEHIAVTTESGQSILNLKHDAFSIVPADSLYEIPTGIKHLTDIDGCRWTLTDRGVVDILPAPTTKEADMSRLHIIGVYVNDRILVNGKTSDTKNNVAHTNVDYMRKMELEHNQNDIFIHFLYTSYTTPSHKFRYRLKGFNDDWQPLASLRDGVKFLHLPPGRYTLEVTGTQTENVDGNCYTLDIIIHPPWWSTKWAYILYALTIIAATICVLTEVRRLRLRRKEFEALLQSSCKSLPETSDGGLLQRTVPEETTESKDTEFLSAVIRAVQQNCSNADYDVARLSEELCMSRATLFRRFQKSAGLTPAEFIKTTRLEKSAQLLSETNKSVAEIAYESGFTDAGYFSKCFKHKFGMLPSQYRQNT